MLPVELFLYFYYKLCIQFVVDDDDDDADADAEDVVCCLCDSIFLLLLQQ